MIFRELGEGYRTILDHTGCTSLVGPGVSVDGGGQGGTAGGSVGRRSSRAALRGWLGGRCPLPQGPQLIGDVVKSSGRRWPVGRQWSGRKLF